MSLLWIIIIVILLFGGFGYGYGYPHYGAMGGYGPVGFILLIVLILYLAGVFRRE